MSNQYLPISWSTSRGQSTYGWNICRLDDRETDKRYRTCGGGYDMIGTVLGQWLEDKYQDRLRSIGMRAGSYFSKAGGYQSHRITEGGSLPYGRPDPSYFYGMTRNDDTGAITIDGACGRTTVLTIADAIGISLILETDRRGRIVGYFASDIASEVAA